MKLEIVKNRMLVALPISSVVYFDIMHTLSYILKLLVPIALLKISN